VKAKIPVSNRSNEETDEPLIANDRNYYKVEKVDQGRVQGRAHALRRQQPRQGTGGLRRGNLPSATYPADHSAAVACAGGVAEGGVVAASGNNIKSSLLGYAASGLGGKAASARGLRALPDGTSVAINPEAVASVHTTTTGYHAGTMIDSTGAESAVVRESFDEVIERLHKKDCK